jgi:histidine ammonia-lyase
VPTSLGQEDHVSMGSISGRKLHTVLDNLEYIQAIELLYAAQAMDFRRPLRSTPIMEACHNYIREKVPFIKDDRVFADDIKALHEIVADGSLLAVAEEAAAQNNIKLDNDDEFGIY